MKISKKHWKLLGFIFAFVLIAIWFGYQNTHPTSQVQLAKPRNKVEFCNSVTDVIVPVPFLYKVQKVIVVVDAPGLRYGEWQQNLQEALRPNRIEQIVKDGYQERFKERQDIDCGERKNQPVEVVDLEGKNRNEIDTLTKNPGILTVWVTERRYSLKDYNLGLNQDYVSVDILNYRSNLGAAFTSSSEGHLIVPINPAVTSAKIEEHLRRKLQELLYW